MRVKKYIVESMPDALQKIRSDLGKDAVIINTKEIRQGGFLGLFTKKKIEVIAATDSSSSAQVKAPAMVKDTRTASAAPYVTESSRQGSSSSIAVLQEKIAEAIERQPEASKNTPAHNESQMAKELYSKPTLQSNSKPAEDQQLMTEMKQMKEMMKKLVSNQIQAEEQSEAIILLEQKLIDHEFVPYLIEEIKTVIISKLQEHDLDLTEEHVINEAKIYLKQMINSVDRKGIASDTQIAHFVGPTGVGKTTTIAKLAAEQVLKHKRKAGFITSDTYRIAAVEQLKTYANILNVPLEVVFSPQELTKAFEQLKGQELIFMDTAGRNYRNEMYVSELNSLLRNHSRSETYLVLSMTMKYKDMKAITENFAKFKIDKVLFTKMDETDSYGPIFNLIHDFSLPLSYVTNGQNVPDDIEEFNEDLWIEQILEG
jgi:flagellar biosynthesis protein FlhF